MNMLGFGQPEGSIIQFAYTVPDLHATMAAYTRQLGIGPWFLVEHFPGSEMEYRGAPTDVDFSLAMAFSGTMAVEVIQQHGEAPSVYRETIDRQGHGFHHWGIATRDFDRDVRRYEDLGYTRAFSARAPVGDRIAYFDTTADMPGMVELIEIGPATDEMFTGWYRAAQDWDGTDPIRVPS
ncbi:MAG: VOC family protein [Acidimicrobiia bacterium]